jgi:hypothetical protein
MIHASRRGTRCPRDTVAAGQHTRPQLRPATRKPQSPQGTARWIFGAHGSPPMQGCNYRHEPHNALTVSKQGTPQAQGMEDPRDHSETVPSQHENFLP